jgi:hypothetical protein
VTRKYADDANSVGNKISCLSDEHSKEHEVIRTWRVSSNISHVNSTSSLFLFRRNAVVLYLYNELRVAFAILNDTY